MRAVAIAWIEGAAEMSKVVALNFLLWNGTCPEELGGATEGDVACKSDCDVEEEGISTNLEPIFDGL